eukprot:MONOS_9683.1-p1 / transcript=MONOS_9683.1 / gene=MONOS_9683 / organism=Monocercomonoides_exilis_PA203 / gene_product=unspecified product / transcript_product=unspecified product / location=Mono_scaffold00409:14009-16217(+) / protein_length=698 / sequence_SO=supercontig / SO=protein_coding / is_pseudo=false
MNQSNKSSNQDHVLIVANTSILANLAKEAILNEIPTMIRPSHFFAVRGLTDSTKDRLNALQLDMLERGESFLKQKMNEQKMPESDSSEDIVFEHNASEVRAEEQEMTEISKEEEEEIRKFIDFLELCKYESELFHVTLCVCCIYNYKCLRDAAALANAAREILELCRNKMADEAWIKRFLNQRNKDFYEKEDASIAEEEKGEKGEDKKDCINVTLSIKDQNENEIGKTKVESHEEMEKQKTCASIEDNCCNVLSMPQEDKATDEKLDIFSEEKENNNLIVKAESGKIDELKEGEEKKIGTRSQEDVELKEETQKKERFEKRKEKKEEKKRRRYERYNKTPSQNSNFLRKDELEWIQFVLKEIDWEQKVKNVVILEDQQRMFTKEKENVKSENNSNERTYRDGSIISFDGEADKIPSTDSYLQNEKDPTVQNSSSSQTDMDNISSTSQGSIPNDTTSLISSITQQNSLLTNSSASFAASTSFDDQTDILMPSSSSVPSTSTLIDIPVSSDTKCTTDSTKVSTHSFNIPIVGIGSFAERVIFAFPLVDTLLNVLRRTLALLCVHFHIFCEGSNRLRAWTPHVTLFKKPSHGKRTYNSLPMWLWQKEGKEQKHNQSKKCALLEEEEEDDDDEAFLNKRKRCYDEEADDKQFKKREKDENDDAEYIEKEYIGEMISDKIELCQMQGRQKGEFYVVNAKGNF